MSVKSGTTWAGIIVTLDATGALATPSSGPTGVLYIDGVANAAAVTISGANPYKWSVTLPALTAGQRVDMYITATIATIATAGVVASEQADTALLSDGVTVASIANNAITALAIAQDAIDADSLKADAVTEIGTGVWASPQRTLTQSAAEVAATFSGSDITIKRGDTVTISFTGLGDLSTYTKIWMTCKSKLSHLDMQSIFQIEKTGNLLYLNGSAASTATDGTLTVVDEVTGAVTALLKPAVSAELIPNTYEYDLQGMTAAGVVNTLKEGDLTVTGDVTRAVA